MIGRSLVRIPSRLIFFFVLKKTNQPNYFGIFLYFIYFFIFLYIFFKILFIFCVPRMPRTPRTVPRTPRCLALCKDPLKQLSSMNSNKLQASRNFRYQALPGRVGLSPKGSEESKPLRAYTGVVRTVLM